MMLLSLLLLVISILILLISWIPSTASSSGASSSVFSPLPFVLDVEHSLGGGPFEKRASFALSPPTVGFEKDKKFQVTEVTEVMAGSSSSSNFIKNVSQFKQLIAANGLYTIRVRRRAETADCGATVVDSEDGAVSSSQRQQCLAANSNVDDDESGFVTTSIPACALLSSLSGAKEGKGAPFVKEELTVHFDMSDTGSRILSVFYGTKPNVLARECSAEAVPASLKINTLVRLGERAVADTLPIDAPGARPPYLGNVKVKGDAIADPASAADGSSPAPQSFLMKYWYVVLALMLYMMRAPEEPSTSTGANAAAEGTGGRAASGPAAK